MKEPVLVVLVLSLLSVTSTEELCSMDGSKKCSDPKAECKQVQCMTNNNCKGDNYYQCVPNSSNKSMAVNLTSLSVAFFLSLGCKVMF